MDEFRKVWSRSPNRFAIHADLPRLARKVYIHTRDNKTLAPPDSALLAIKKVVLGLAEQLLDVRTAILHFQRVYHAHVASNLAISNPLCFKLLMVCSGKSCPLTRARKSNKHLMSRFPTLSEINPICTHADHIPGVIYNHA